MPIDYYWGATQNIGGPPGGLAYSNRLCIATNDDGHLEAFALGSDGAICHSWQEGLQVTSSWSDWWTFGHPKETTFANSGLSIQAAKNIFGCIELFLLGDDRNIWHIAQVAKNANWGGWENLGNPETSANDFFMTVAANAYDYVELALVDRDSGNVFWKGQDVFGTFGN